MLVDVILPRRHDDCGRKTILNKYDSRVREKDTGSATAAVLCRLVLAAAAVGRSVCRSVRGVRYPGNGKPETAANENVRATVTEE